MKKTWIALAAATMVAAGFATVGFSTSDPSAGMLTPDDEAVVAQGAEIYVAQCAACHGANLEGEPKWQVRGADGLMPAPPHNASGHTWHHPDAQLFQITKYGTAAVVGGGYQSAMIGFGDVLSDEEIVAVLSFIKSTWPEDIRVIHDERNAMFESAR